MEHYATQADFIKALAHPTRLQILDLLKSGEKCVCEIFPALNLEQPGVSRHLAILKMAGIVQSRKEGLKVIYRVTDPRIFEILDLLAVTIKQIWRDKLELLT